MAAPDLRPQFEHVTWRPMAHSFGVEVGSDWSDKDDADPVFGVFKQCGFWTSAEAAILYECAQRHPGFWLDIGGHTGWTAAHILQSPECDVTLVDPMYANPEFKQRTKDNLGDLDPERYALRAATSATFFSQWVDPETRFDGFVIDGDHERPHVLNDARNAVDFMEPDGIIALHDAVGRPVQDAVQMLQEAGFNIRVYLTPHVVTCCWLGGDFTPPEYEPDPAVAAGLAALLPQWMLAAAA